MTGASHAVAAGDDSVIFYHGTTNRKADAISVEGFLAISYFTSNIDDARYYAATGGEWNLQQREEAYEAEHGEPPREVYGPDVWEMFEALYPPGEHPVILVVHLSPAIIASCQPDAGAIGGVVSADPLPAEIVVNVLDMDWPTLSACQSP